MKVAPLRIISSIAFSLGLCLLMGCTAAIPSTTTLEPVITSFTATPTTIMAGGSTTLTGVFAAGNGVLTPGNIVVCSAVGVTVTPSDTTTYTLTVTNAAGETTTQAVTVTVTAVAPAISGFTALPATITVGVTTSLTGLFTGGTGMITPGNISVTSGTSVSVTPSDTTTYTLTVTNPTGVTATQAVTVTVTAVAPTISGFTALPATITAGGTTSLIGVFTGGTGMITPGNLPVTSGTCMSVTPSDTTTYTLTVTNAAGATASLPVIVTVNPVLPVITSFTATPTSITTGSSSSLLGVFANGTGIITPGNISASSGVAVLVSPSVTTTYTLTVTPTSGTAVTGIAMVSVATAGDPAAPTNLIATPGNQLVSLSWSGVAAATSYSVMRFSPSLGSYVVIGTTTGTVFEDDAVVNNTTYTYVVVAVDASGQSAYSASASATPVAPPSVSSSLVATPGDGQVMLTWTGGVSAANYQVGRSTVSGGPYTTVAMTSSTNFTDTGLSDGTAYYYVVYSVNPVATSAASNQAEAIPIAAISGLAALPSDSQIALVWNISAGATSYNIDLYSGSVCAGSPMVVATTSNRYIDTGLVDGDSYSFTVTGVNATGSTAASACVTATPEAGTTATMLNTPTVGLGTWYMNDWDAADEFVDLAMQARPWVSYTASGTGDPSFTLDANGWPMGDADTVLQTFLISGQTTPMSNFEGTYKLVFTGKADVSSQWFTGSVANYAYNASTNTSTADVIVTGNGDNYINLIFTNTQRTAASATNTGFTNLHLYRPGYPTDGSAIFTTPFLNAMGKVTTIRMMDWTQTNNNYVVNWADRTTPSYATQQTNTNSWTGPSGAVYSGISGVALEYQIMLCNTIKADCYFNIPVVASDDFVTKMAETIAFGSDGTNPYTSTQANPVYPPLNPQLRVYLEYANEVWNSSSAVFGAVDDICSYLSTTDPTNPLLHVYTADILGNSTQGVYSQMWRYPAWRMSTISQIFEGVFGSSQMITRVRPLLETQQGDGQGTLDSALQFLDAYAKTLNTTASKLIYGGGGSAYYGVINANSAAPDSIFAAGNYPDPNVLNNWAVDAMWLTNYGLKHVSYEGGPGINSAFTDTENLAINGDARMETMMDAYKTSWDQMGGDLLIYYDLAGSTAWEFTPDIFSDGSNSGTNTPKFAALADNQSVAKAAVTLGGAMPGTTMAVNQSTQVSNPNIHNDYGYNGTIGSGTTTCTVTNQTGSYIAYPVHAASAFTGNLSIFGIGDNGTAGGTTVAETLEVWINGIDTGAITLPATTSNSSGVNSSKLTVNLPAGLSMIRLVATTGAFNLCSLTVQ